jgi:Rrf2 family protein
MNSTFVTAVHLVTFLTFAQKRDCLATSREIAERIQGNPAVVRKVATYLQQAGLVKATKGTAGGYSLAMKADEVNLRMVFEAVEPLVGDFFGLERAAVKAEGCGSAILAQINLQLAHKLAGAKESLKAQLAEVTVQQVFEGVLMSLADKS